MLTPRYKYDLVHSHLDLLLRSKLIDENSEEASDILEWLDDLWEDIPIGERHRERT